MASNYLGKGLKRSALTVALGLCFAGGVQAQTNTAGAVTGRATTGDTINITNAVPHLRPSMVGQIEANVAAQEVGYKVAAEDLGTNHVPGLAG